MSKSQSMLNSLKDKKASKFNLAIIYWECIVHVYLIEVVISLIYIFLLTLFITICSTSRKCTANFHNWCH